MMDGGLVLGKARAKDEQRESLPHGKITMAMFALVAAVGFVSGRRFEREKRGVRERGDK